MQNNSEQDRIDHNRVIWHSRRGMLELDIVLEPFARERYTALDSGVQAQYRQLLSCEDQQLFDWLLQKTAVDDTALVDIVALVLDHHARRANA
ncbi:MAG: succinate dehydrogenase assembly factor 2 [Gammaproteobacteria bacterium]|nr:succinate dehydrogenase assembly factor 2 [Gammaproteobacteria bacterium]MBT8152181.1 succinate dehydrogenase assembly factor 2 [Gammaproteobacteria bacterium]NND38794.1 succinate dehydrogenase assembly factor 2 [Pseudomonadales bacterium]NNM10860.1 succinate dehydrogenase assembly factor 2 [Pseudomonadales bacterium]RZV54853.1 MAG: succinate dehydrogenase assembly factor 2 family protein [Pseudomonadales bacterium]